MKNRHVKTIAEFVAEKKQISVEVKKASLLPNKNQVNEGFGLNNSKIEDLVKALKKIELPVKSIGDTLSGNVFGAKSKGTGNLFEIKVSKPGYEVLDVKSDEKYPKNVVKEYSNKELPMLLKYIEKTYGIGRQVKENFDRELLSDKDRELQRELKKLTSVGDFSYRLSSIMPGILHLFLKNEKEFSITISTEDNDLRYFTYTDDENHTDSFIRKGLDSELFSRKIYNALFLTSYYDVDNRNKVIADSDAIFKVVEKIFGYDSNTDVYNDELGNVSESKETINPDVLHRLTKMYKELQDTFQATKISRGGFNPSREFGDLYEILSTIRKTTQNAGISIASLVSLLRMLDDIMHIRDTRDIERAGEIKKRIHQLFPKVSDEIKNAIDGNKKIDESALGDEIHRRTMDSFDRRDREFAERKAVFLEKYPLKQTTLIIPKGSYDLSNKLINKNITYELTNIKIFNSGDYELAFTPVKNDISIRDEDGKWVSGYLLHNFYIEYADGTIDGYIDSQSKRTYKLFDDESKKLLTQIGKDFTSKFFLFGTNTPSTNNKVDEKMGPVFKHKKDDSENKDEDSKSKRRYIEVTFTNGDSLKTEINGTVDEIKKYYIGKSFNLGHNGDDLMTKGKSVKFLDK